MAPAAVPRLVLLDTVTAVAPHHANAVIVTGSHGGASVVKYALAVPATLYVFNDAGIGKDDAGVTALAELERAGQAAVAVAHTSARIGEASDAWDNGVVSRVNAQAAARGLRCGDRLCDVIAVQDATRSAT